MYNVILGVVHATIVRVEKQYEFHIFGLFCSLNYPACNAFVPYYIAICGLSGCTISFHITSYTEKMQKKYFLKILIPFVVTICLMTFSNVRVNKLIVS
jgi:hypothetical protein